MQTISPTAIPKAWRSSPTWFKVCTVVFTVQAVLGAIVLVTGSN